jgi:poly(A) polymerase
MKTNTPVRVLTAAVACCCLAVVVSAGLHAHAAESSGNSGSKPRLTFVTYNVLADRKDAAKRVPALLKLLENSSADVIALQEVAPWFMKALFAQEWTRKYHPAPAREDTQAPGGLLILSKTPILKHGFYRLAGRQGRGVLAVKLKASGRELLVATVHLESPLESGRIRAKQLTSVLGLLGDKDDAVLLGDFNFGDGEQPETRTLPKSYVDPWPLLKKGQPGYTWNIEKSDMARRGSFPGEKSRRLDRILMRSKFWKPKSVSIIGDTPVKKGDKSLFPSDHFGLMATFAALPAMP